ncbi:MAG TPA: DoxX family protein, partial [Salinimicrobium sp.]|nr:DoxX family protein [Salinimicrobium sp.]
SSLTFGASGIMLEILGFAATILEFVLGIFLILGYKIRATAFCSGILLLLFAIGMSLNTHVKYALDYSVFSACFGAFLLAYQPVGKWSLDNSLRK